MRVAIDARAFAWPGLGRYTRSLMTALAAVDRQNEYVVMLQSADRAEFEAFRHKHLNKKFSVVTVDGEYYSLREQTVFWRQAERVRADLFHFTHFNVPVGFSKPYVVTVHDVTRLIFPGQKEQGLARQLAYEWVLRRAVARARAVIAVSETTKEELEKLPWRAGLPCIYVIPEGVADSFFEPIDFVRRAKARAMLGIQAPYLLYIGVWMNHKNLPRLLEAFGQLRQKFSDLRLVMTGRPKPGYINMMKLARAAGVEEQIIFPGFVPEELLPAVYAESAAVVLPSLYEGFGLPALEAAAVGAPVVTSNVSATAEIMKDGALLVNPEYTPGIVSGIVRVLADDSFRKSLTRSGQARAAEFTWSRCANQTLAVYSKCV